MSICLHCRWETELDRVGDLNFLLNVIPDCEVLVVFPGAPAEYSLKRPTPDRLNYELAEVAAVSQGAARGKEGNIIPSTSKRCAP